MSFSLKKYRIRFLEIYWNYQKKKGLVQHEDRLEIEGLLKKLQTKIIDKDLDSVKSVYQQVRLSEERIFPRSVYYRWCKTFFSNAFFIIVIIFLRQTWFEPFQIPTGSMRPTLKELDRLVVAKNQLGSTFPLPPTISFLSLMR